MSKTIMAGALVASVLLALPFAASADPEHKAVSASEAGQAEGHGEHGSAAPQSASLAGAWMALTAARDAIAADVESGALGDVHEKAEPLPKLVAELVEQSGDLDAGKRTRVEGAAKQVARVADALHEAADGGDAAKTRKQLSRLDGLLQLIHAQYPPGSLDADSHGHESHSAVPGRDQGEHAHMERPAGVVDVTPQVTVHILALDQLRFEPNRIEVQAEVPTRIVLENSGVLEHTFVVKTPDGAQDWVHLHVPPGVTKAATYQLNEPGTYPVLCTIPGHTEIGMIGELVVLAGHGPANSHP